MNWSNVKLILTREIRDQLRDRRTLFMIAVLPILLYPLLGMSLFQVAQFVQERPTTVLIVGAGDLAELPPLLDEEDRSHFDSKLFSDPKKARLLNLDFLADDEGEVSGDDKREQARLAVETEKYDAAVFFPENFAQKATAYQKEIRQWREQAQRGEENGSLPVLDIQPEIIYSTANEKSQVTFARLYDVLGRWNERLGRNNLQASGLPANAAKPLDVATTDLAGAIGHRGSAVWAKILPLVLLVWAMTGAFYPAVDLCAGEKERGTLETLLSSPAERSEIVVGKLLTIMLFSMSTAVLNLLSMGVTGWLLMARLPQLGPPPLSALGWLAIALVPVSALFSALCLALAAFARSTKEGQYYLIPLLLVTMPLVILPMTPAVELNMGNSLIPVTGVMLLLRSVLEGNFWQAWVYVVPVAVVTLACCLLAIRWAIDQFNSESVLFRESERLDMGLWLRHLVHDRRPTPTVAAAVFCGVMILVIRFFMSFAVPEMSGFGDFAMMAIVTQLVVIAAPALAMTMLFTSSPRQTLLLKRPAWLTVPAAAALAVVAHPAVYGLQVAISRLYPVSEEVASALEGILEGAPSFWQLILVVSVAPAICEELAFRGFILSGFRHLGHKWRAIVYSSLFFGFSHALLQQSMVACILGVLIGFLAVQTGSILPGMVFHMVHNALAVATTKITAQHTSALRLPEWFVSWNEQQGLVYHWPASLMSLVLATGLLTWFGRLPHPVSDEEKLQQAKLNA